MGQGLMTMQTQQLVSDRDRYYKTDLWAPSGILILHGIVGYFNIPGWNVVSSTNNLVSRIVNPFMIRTILLIFCRKAKFYKSRLLLYKISSFSSTS